MVGDVGGFYMCKTFTLKGTPLINSELQNVFMPKILRGFDVLKLALYACLPLQGL